MKLIIHNKTNKSDSDILEYVITYLKTADKCNHSVITFLDGTVLETVLNKKSRTFVISGV